MWWVPVGFALQMMLIILVDTFVGFGNISDTGYGPWVEIGDSILPAGPAGLAMSLGAIFGLLFGMLVYSVVVGVVISLIRQPSYE
jgi:hypothetical protein